MKLRPGDVTLTFRPKQLGPREPSPAQRVRKLLKHAKYLALECTDLAGQLEPIDPDLDSTKNEFPFQAPIERKET